MWWLGNVRIWIHWWCLSPTILKRQNIFEGWFYLIIEFGRLAHATLHWVIQNVELPLSFHLMRSLATSLWSSQWQSHKSDPPIHGFGAFVMCFSMTKSHKIEAWGHPRMIAFSFTSESPIWLHTSLFRADLMLSVHIWSLNIVRPWCLTLLQQRDEGTKRSVWSLDQGSLFEKWGLWWLLCEHAGAPVALPVLDY